LVGLADSIVKILEDAELRQKMGDEGRKLVDPSFRAETMVRQISEVYQMLIVRFSKRIAKFNKKFSLL
jgi:glycosyltransferase involved in cell wall biosynthesis